MISMIALSLVIALGPIFVACIVFESTRKFFVGWLSQCLNYVLLFALIVTIFQMILSIIADEWGSLDGAAQPEAAAMVFVAFSLLGAIFFLATPMIASGISGSASLAVKDFARAGAWMHHHASRVPTPTLPKWGSAGGGSVSRGSQNNSRRAA
jgi:type IV secretion system protein VirB6